MGGAALVRSSFDLSAVSERLRESRLPVLASFLAGNLNRTGRRVLEELPDDPSRARPYVYYEHPAGKIVLAPHTDEAGATRWKFTAATLAAAQRLNDALRAVPTAFDNVRNPQAESPYFIVRALAYSLAPGLIRVAGGLELWQWLGLLLLFARLPLGLHFAMRSLERALGRAIGRDALHVRHRYTILVRILAAGASWLLASTVLGLPDWLSSPLYAAGWVLLIAGVTWQLYRLIDLVTRGFHAFTSRTHTTMDDVAVSLVSGLGKILLVVGAAVAVADVIGPPYETVLAGVGISGLAFAIASRDVLANLFGSAIIASDRTFKKGDFISLGDVQGTVEKVGLRSTHLRPLDDTRVVIPNSSITTDRVTNLSSGRRIRVVETIHINHDASVEGIRALRERIRDELLEDEMVRVGLSTVSLYAVDMDVSFHIRTTVYDDFLFHKHRLLARLLETLEASGVERAVIRKD